MLIIVNEKPCDVDDSTTLFAVRDQLHPTADLLLCNDQLCGNDQPLHEADRIVLIERGATLENAEVDRLLSLRHGTAVHQRLKMATIGIAGAGGLGSAIAVALVRAGIGGLILVDFDIVEASNLNRQQYFMDQIGLPKVEALRANLLRINPYCRVKSENQRLSCTNLAPLLGGCDILVEAFDCPEAKAQLTAQWLHSFPDKALVAASGMAGYGPSNSIRTRHAMANLYVCGDGHSAIRPGCGLMAPRVGIVAHHQANTVLRLLLGEFPVEESTIEGSQDKGVRNGDYC